MPNTSQKLEGEEINHDIFSDLRDFYPDVESKLKPDIREPSPNLAMA
jgi:hypothetical protein